MRYLTLGEVLDLHRRLIEQSGGASGMRELGGVESAVAQPQMTFSGEGLYPTIESKATALCFSLVMNHPFVDGNKRIGHAAMEAEEVQRGGGAFAGQVKSVAVGIRGWLSLKNRLMSFRR